VDKDDDGVVTPEELTADWLRHDLTLLQALDPSLDPSPGT